jgi:hypothetical protein
MSVATMWQCNCGKVNDDSAQICISCGELRDGVSSSTLNNGELINFTLDTRRKILEKAIKEDLMHNDDMDKCIQSCNEILVFDRKNKLATLVKNILKNARDIHELMETDLVDKSIHDEALLTIHDLENHLEEYHKQFGNTLIPNAFDGPAYFNPPASSTDANGPTCQDALQEIKRRYHDHLSQRNQTDQRILELVQKIKKNNGAILKKRTFFAVEDYFDFQKTVHHQIDHIEKLRDLTKDLNKVLPAYILTDKKLIRKRLYTYLTQVREFFFQHLKQFEDEFLAMQETLTLEGLKEEFLTVKLNRHMENFRKIDDLKNEDPKLKQPLVVLQYPTEREFRNFLVKVERTLEQQYSKQQEQELQDKIEAEKRKKDTEIARTKFIAVIRELESSIEHQLALAKSDQYRHASLLKDVEEHASKLKVYQQLHKQLPSSNDITYLSTEQLMRKVDTANNQHNAWKAQQREAEQAEEDEKRQARFLKGIIEYDRKLDVLFKSSKHAPIDVKHVTKQHDILLSKLQRFHDQFGSYPKSGDVYYNTPETLRSNLEQALQANRAWKQSKRRESTLLSLKERDNKIDILLKTARQQAFHPPGIQKLVTVQKEKLEFFKQTYHSYPDASELICNTPTQLQTKLEHAIRMHNDWLTGQKESRQRSKDKVKQAYLEKDRIKRLARLREAEIFIELSFKKAKEPNWKYEFAKQKVEKQIPFLEDYKRKFESYPIKELQYGSPKLLQAALKVALSEHESTLKAFEKQKKNRSQPTKSHQTDREMYHMLQHAVQNIYDLDVRDLKYKITQGEQFVSYYKQVDRAIMKAALSKLHYKHVSIIKQDIDNLKRFAKTHKNHPVNYI